MTNSIVALILAILKAVPALDGILDKVLSQRARNREQTALRRKQQKDTAADEAIDRPPSP